MTCCQMPLGAGTENLRVNPAVVAADRYGLAVLARRDVHLHGGFGLVDISGPVGLFGD